MRRAILVLLLLGLAGNAWAGNDINDLPALNQGQFHDLSKDLGAVLTFKQLQAAAPEGILGFNLGVDVSTTDVAHQSAWDTATGGSDLQSVSLARVRASKGLPFGFDLGGFYSYATNSNVKAWGADLRYAILDGSSTTPALGLRAAFSELGGVSGLAFRTRSLDLTISRSYGPFSPYAGLGRVWITSNPDAYTGLHDESISADEGFVGIAVSVLVVNLALEVNRTAGNNTYSARLGFGF